MNKLLICLGVMMLSVCISNSQKMYDLDTDESLLNWKSDYVFKIAGHHRENQTLRPVSLKETNKDEKLFNTNPLKE